MLEQITQNTCANKILAMRSSYNPKELEKCRVCECYKDNKECINYKSYNFTFKIRQGNLAIMRK